MNSKKRHKRIYRILRITVIVLVTIILLTGVTGYFVIHRYINKVNLISADARKESVETNMNSAEESEIDSAQGNSEASDVSIYSIQQDTKEAKEIEVGNMQNTDAVRIEAEQRSAVSSINSSDAATKKEETSRECSQPSPQPDKEDRKHQEINQDQQKQDGNEINENQSQEIKAIITEIEKNIAGENNIANNDEVKNILLIGTDDKGVYLGGYSNSIALITLNKEAQKIVTTSFLPNIYLMIPGHGCHLLNSVYDYGGGELLLTTLEQNFKINIDRYIQIDLNGFVGVIDELGGLELEIPSKEIDSVNQMLRIINRQLDVKEGKDLIKSSGDDLRNGKQVFAYLCTGKASQGGSTGSNPLKLVIDAVYQKFFQQDITTLDQSLQLLLPQITTNYAESEIFSIFFQLQNYKDYDITRLDIPVAGTYTSIDINDTPALGIDFAMNIEEIKAHLYP